MNGTTNGHHAPGHKTSPELDLFDDLFPELVEVLTKKGLEDAETGWGHQWLKKVLEYNVPYGKKNRGLSVASSYKHFVKNPSEEDLKLARVLGWCVELFQAYFLVTDDIMDKSLTRRGMPCWYKKREVGMIAVNDSYYIESCIYKILKHYIRNKPYYIEVVELFLETGFQTVLGQCLDLTTAPPEAEADFTYFTVEKHASIVKWKTSFYSFYLPVAIAMYMADISDEESHKQAKTVLLQMGHFFQVQDDYLDCYGKPEVIGKVGTDIQDNKCGWLIVTALEKASEHQKKDLIENYGRWNDECVQKVKDIYSDLGLENMYKQYEESSYQELMTSIDVLTKDSLPKEVFIDFASKIYKRKK